MTDSVLRTRHSARGTRHAARGDHFEAVAGAICPWAGLTGVAAPKDWQEYTKIPWLWWEDRNGDGIIQQEETRATRIKAQNSHCVIDADPNFYATGMYNELYWQRISPKEVLPNGVPLYDDTSLLQVDYAKDHSCYTYDLAVNPADGSLLMYAGSDIKHLERTEIWPINYWTRDGKLQWRCRLGCRWHDMYEFPIPKPSELYGCTRNLGITDGITGFSCYFGQVQLLTTDGVPIGTLMKDGRSGETGPDQIQCEWFTGQLVKLKAGRWFLLGGDQDGRVLSGDGAEHDPALRGQINYRAG